MKEQLLALLEPIVAALDEMDPADPEAAARLGRQFPLTRADMMEVAALFRRGVGEGWLCDREAGGVRFSRVAKGLGARNLTIDAVAMSAPGPGHLHPAGEFDLCFAVDGSPKFDGNPPGWTVYPPGSWHVPTVAGGSMDILYFLPEGKIEFGDRPGT